MTDLQQIIEVLVTAARGYITEFASAMGVVASPELLTLGSAYLVGMLCMLPIEVIASVIKRGRFSVVALLFWPFFLVAYGFIVLYQVLFFPVRLLRLTPRDNYKARHPDGARVVRMDDLFDLSNVVSKNLMFIHDKDAERHKEVIEAVKKAAGKDYATGLRDIDKKLNDVRVDQDSLEDRLTHMTETLDRAENLLEELDKRTRMLYDASVQAAGAHNSVAVYIDTMRHNMEKEFEAIRRWTQAFDEPPQMPDLVRDKGEFNKKLSENVASAMSVAEANNALMARLTPTGKLHMMGDVGKLDPAEFIKGFTEVFGRAPRGEEMNLYYEAKGKRAGYGLNQADGRLRGGEQGFS